MLQKQIRPAILLFMVLSVITGIVYPLFVTGIARLFFYDKANGSLIYRDKKPAGSLLIGQNFDGPGYFWGRLSATAPVSFNAAASSGSNLGPSNPALLEAVKARIKALKAVDGSTSLTINQEHSQGIYSDNRDPIPVDLVTFSASGLDPHISLAAAFYQIPRVSRARGLTPDLVRKLVNQYTRGRFLGVIGEPVVNVLEVNLALDGYQK